jgi:hypothetical protein
MNFVFSDQIDLMMHATYYHGSPCKIMKAIMPMPSYVLRGDAAVFATHIRAFALMFIGRWRDADIELGVHNGRLYIKEMYHGAFNLLRVPGYVYTCCGEFHSDDRLGMPSHEFVCMHEVPIVTVEKIACAFDEIIASGEFDITYA